ncbi:uncharacterized protein LOC131426114 [Malaya genurostris]|uniref:uncharacterized protein LOC131426114 n=1 Tax=Malaya genurostris TaxID=325434 RepID=UPI0026F402C0|nr:uncharacterized protein LOC131426114 [Malaya genurostris]
MANTPIHEQKLAKAFQQNSNMHHIDTVKTITADTKPEDLTEAQKQAFIAMMRMAIDPHERNWTKRLKKLNEKNQQFPHTVPSNPKRRRLRKKIAKMRAKKQFPLHAEVRSDPARRYGFIPKSQKKTDLADYAKV